MNNTVVDFACAVSTSIAQRAALPEQSGVYVVKTSNRTLYVGMSDNVQRRLRTHNKLAAMLQYGSEEEITVYCFPMLLEHARSVEEQLIKELNPPLNLPSGRIAEIASERGISERQLVEEAFKGVSAIDEAAFALGIYPNSLRHWLTKNNLTAKKVVRFELVQQHE